MIRHQDMDLIGLAAWVIEWIAKKMMREVIRVALEGASVLQSFSRHAEVPP